MAAETTKCFPKSSLRTPVTDFDDRPIPEYLEFRHFTNSQGDMLGLFDPEYIRKSDWYIIEFGGYTSLKKKKNDAGQYIHGKHIKGGTGVLRANDNPYFEEILRVFSVKSEKFVIHYQQAKMNEDFDMLAIKRALPIVHRRPNDGATHKSKESEKEKYYFNATRGCTDDIRILWQNKKRWLEVEEDEAKHPERYSTLNGVSI